MNESLWHAPRFRLLVLAAAIVFICNLLIMNDLVIIWSGAESAFVWNSLFEWPGFFLPYQLDALVAGGELRAFLLRLPGVLVLLLGLLLFFLIGRKVFGVEAAVMALLALAASLLLPNVSKLATLDSWAFSVQLTGICFLILFLKKPEWKVQLLFYFFLGLSLWFRPLSSAVLFTVFPGLLFFVHPQGKRMGRVNPWLALLAGGVILWGAGQLKWEWPGLVFSFNTRAFLFTGLLGWLPFWGFLAAGLVETVVKARKGEELSIINAAWLAAALAAHSLAVQMVLALLVGKQLRAYFDPRYPYRDIVRGGSVLHLLAVFFAAMGLMLYGFREFGAVGFRSGLALGAAYWILSLLSVIGLFGLNRRLVLGGTLFSGLLATFFFWMQVSPLLESRRDLPQRLLSEALKIRPSEDTPLVVSQPGYELHQSNIALYGRSGFPSIEMWEGEKEEEPGPNEKRKVWIMEKAASERFPGTGKPVELQGWNDLLQPVTYMVVVNGG